MAAPSARRRGETTAAAANSPRRSARLAARRTLQASPDTVAAPTPAVAPQRRRRRLPLPFRRLDNQACLAYHVAHQQAVFVEAWPGTGRSSQVPRVLHGAGHGRVVCSQTYRLAAKSAAARAAADMRAGEVGCAVTFDELLAASGAGAGAGTAVTYTTHQALLRALAADPLLACYGAVVVDDADDGMLLTCAVLSCVKAAAAHRPDLRVVLCVRGTTLYDEEAVHTFFPDAVHLWFRTRLGLCPWEFMSEPVTDYVPEAVQTVRRIHGTEPPGDVLVFLPSCADVEAAERLLVAHAMPGLVTRCLHDGLATNLIDGVLCPAPDGERKVVLATDVADSAVFVEGINYIVDSGFRCTDNAPLSLSPATTGTQMFRDMKASVRLWYHIKRRENRGRCFCLYTREESREMMRTGCSPLRTRTDDVDSLAGIILVLKDLGIIRGGVDESFDFVLPPRPETLRRALGALEATGAVGLDGEVTEQGRRMSRWTLERCYF